jgi:diguanylate cyclase (GGDEF)-like protein
VATILIAEPSTELAQTLVEAFSSRGHQVATIRDPALLASVAADLVVVDGAILPGDPIDTLRSLGRGRVRPVPAVLTGDDLDAGLKLQVLELGAELVTKPYAVRELVARGERLILLCSQLLVPRDAAYVDPLTQAHSHRSFDERLREEFRRAHRYDDPLAVVLVDLDHFKILNNELGTPVGDQVLRQVADCLRQSVRETDQVSRCGGEEFALLLPKTSMAGALTVAERVWRDIAAIEAVPGRRITASLGVASYPYRGVLSPDQLLRVATDALYRAKRQGRNRIGLDPGAFASAER